LSTLADLLAEVGQKQQQQATEAGQGADGQPNKQKGRTEQINGSKARRAVTYVISFCVHMWCFSNAWESCFTVASTTQG